MKVNDSGIFGFGIMTTAFLHTSCTQGCTQLRCRAFHAVTDSAIVNGPLGQVLLCIQGLWGTNYLLRNIARPDDASIIQFRSLGSEIATHHTFLPSPVFLLKILVTVIFFCVQPNLSPRLVVVPSFFFIIIIIIIYPPDNCLLTNDCT